MQEIAGVKNVDQRRMDNLREELCIEKCLMGRLMNSRIKSWAGHVDRMNENRVPMIGICPPGVVKEKDRVRLRLS